MKLFHTIGFFIGAITILMLNEMSFVYKNHTSIPFIEADKNSLIIYTSPSCRYCAKLHHRISQEESNLNKKSINIRFIELSNNIVDGVGSAIIQKSKKPHKMREYIFKTQHLWLNENDLNQSIINLIRLCSRVEDVNIERVYDIVPALMVNSRKICRSLGHNALPTVFMVKKLEGAQNISKLLTKITDYTGSAHVN